LENRLDSLPDATPDELIKWGLEAMRRAITDVEITSYNTAVSIVGKGQEYKILSSEELQPYLNTGMEVV
jgi:20S proteasome alpha/beta subunit